MSIDLGNEFFVREGQKRNPIEISLKRLGDSPMKRVDLIALGS